MAQTAENMRASSMIHEAIALNGVAFVNPGSVVMTAAADRLVKRGSLVYAGMQGGYKMYRENAAYRAALDAHQDASELAACRRVPGGF